MMDACDGQTTRRERLVYVAAIEERFLPVQADAFTGSARAEKASACSARNDSLSSERTVRKNNKRFENDCEGRNRDIISGDG